jgi:hypothetical protein
MIKEQGVPYPAIPQATDLANEIELAVRAADATLLTVGGIY